MRGREFFMKDNYSFDIDAESARRSYNKMFVSYLRTYARMGLKPIPMQADSGAIGGDMSHEFIVLANTGESAVYCDSAWIDTDALALEIDFKTDLQPIVDKWTELYAATDDKHDPKNCPIDAANLFTGRGIEVGHIFYFGTKYSVAMGATVSDDQGKDVPVEMGSYGIGVSRLVGAIIEANYDENGIVWPESVAPFKVGLMNLRSGHDACDAVCEKLYADLNKAGVETLYDERDERAGVKFAEMDLIGLPWQVAVGPRGVKAGTVEIKRRGGEREEISAESALARLV
jgi:prolyl-tRNA synthetase